VSDWISAGGKVEQFRQLVEAAPDWMKPETGTEVDASPARAQAAAEEQALIDELARLNQVDYDRRRTEAANELGIRCSTLDGAREAKRAEIEAPPRAASIVRALGGRALAGTRGRRRVAICNRAAHSPSYRS
jgi:hypothetical protein